MSTIKPATRARTGKPPKLYLVDGVLVSCADLATRVGISASTMNARLRKMTPKQAMELGGPHKRSKPGSVFGGKPVRSYEFQGQAMTVGQLAQIAGCNSHAMNLRLRRWSVEHAVAMGARAKPIALTPGGRKPRTYAVGDEQLTVRQLTERAGCQLSAMRERLRTMTPEVALAMGKAGRRGRGKKPEFFAPKPAKQQPVAKALAKASMTTRVLNTPAKHPSGPVIIPANVKRTVAPAPVDKRFAVDPKQVVPIFSRMKPGQYLPSDSALVRHLESA